MSELPQSSLNTSRPLEADLWYEALLHVVRQPADTSQATIVGAAAGILYGAGRLETAELIRIVRGYLGGTATNPQHGCGIIRGLLATAREVAWHVQEIMAALDEQFGTWDESAFLASLPDLRLAFSDLTLQEITRIADSVAQMHGATELGPLVQLDLEEHELHAALELSQQVANVLRTDRVSQ